MFDAALCEPDQFVEGDAEEILRGEEIPHGRLHGQDGGDCRIKEFLFSAPLPFHEDQDGLVGGQCVAFVERIIKPGGEEKELVGQEETCLTDQFLFVQRHPDGEREGKGGIAFERGRTVSNDGHCIAGGSVEEHGVGKSCVNVPFDHFRRIIKFEQVWGVLRVT